MRAGTSLLNLSLKKLISLFKWFFDLSANSLRPMKYPAIIKKYLFTHVRSRFLKVDLTQAAYAIYLPVQRFQKASAQSVYRKTREAIE